MTWPAGIALALLITTAVLILTDQHRTPPQ
jgi:hypothetical protein